MTRSQQFAFWSVNTVEICWGDCGKVKRSKFSTPRAIFKGGYFLWVVGGVISSCVFKQNPNHSTIHRFLRKDEVNRATPWGLQHGCIGRFNRPGDIQYQVIHINRLLLFFYFSNHLLASCPSTSTQIRFMVFEAGSGQVVGQHQQEVKQLFPHERWTFILVSLWFFFLKHCFDLELSWVEQDPLELLQSVEICIKVDLKYKDQLIANPKPGSGGAVKEGRGLPGPAERSWHHQPERNHRGLAQVRHVLMII